MVMSPEWLRFDEEERLRLEQSKGDPARVGASPVLPGKNGWLQDLVERVTEQIATRPPQPQLNSASQRIIANRAPDVAPNYDYGTGLNRTIAPLKALQGFVGDVAAEGPGFLRDPSAALDAPLLPVRTIGQGLDALGVDTGLQDLSVRNPILQRLGIEAPFDAMRDAGSGINRMAGEAAIPTKPWEIALQALPAAMATSRGGNAMLREFLNLPEDALLDPAIARRFRSLFEGDFLPATAKGFWSGPGGGNPAAREVMQNLDTVAGQDRNRAVEQAYQGRTMDARYSAPQDERGAISQNISEPQPVDAINANNFGESIRQKIDLQDERAVFSKLEGLKADEERLAQELTDLQGGATPTVKHPSQAGWTPEEHAANLRFRIGQLRREGQTYVDSLAERGSLPKGAVFETMKPNTPSLVGPRPPMEEGPQPSMLPPEMPPEPTRARPPAGEEPVRPPVPVRDEPVKPGTFPGGRAPMGEEPMPSSAAPDAEADLMQGADESDLEYAVRLRMSGLSKDEIARIEQANSKLTGARIDQYQQEKNRLYERAGRMNKRSNALKQPDQQFGPGGRAPMGEESYAMPGGARDAAQPPLQTKQAMVEQAKREFGITTDPAKAKYLLDDGTMVGGKGPWEKEAHVNVGTMPSVSGSYTPPAKDGTWEDINKFGETTGAIRVTADGKGFEIRQPLTEAQARLIRRQIAAVRDDPTTNVLLDFPNLPNGKRAHKILRTQAEADAFLREHNLAPPSTSPGRMPPNPRTAPRAPEGGPRPGGAAQQAQPDAPYARETQKVNDLAKALLDDDSSTAQAKFIAAVIEHSNAQRAGKTPDTLDSQIGRVLAGNVKQAEMRKMLDRVGWNKDRVDDLARMLLSGSLKTPEEVNHFLKDANKVHFWKKMHYYWMNSVLSGYMTQARNIVGNASTSAYSPVKRGMGAAADTGLSLIIPGRDRQQFWSEVPASVGGALHGLPKGLQAAFHTMATGISPAAASKLELEGDPPIRGVAGTLAGIPTRMLSAADEFFSSVNFFSELYAGAARQASKEGLKGAAFARRVEEIRANPPDKLMEEVSEAADRLTFRNEATGVTGSMVKGLSKIRSSHFLMSYALPFLKTPANVVKYGIENSPLGLLNVPAWQKAIKGNPEGVDELTGAFLGSALAAAVGGGIGAGVLDITAAPPLNQAERDRWLREGKQPFSVKMPGVGWVEYKSIPAINTTLLLVAAVNDAAKSGKDYGPALEQLGTSITSNLFEQSYLNGLAEFLDTAAEPGRYLERYMTRTAQGFVPASGFMRNLAQTTDSTKRDPEGVVESFKANIPGLSTTIRPQRTAFGEAVKPGLGKKLPVQVSRSAQSALDKELERLDYNVGFVSDKIGTYTLTADEQNEYQALAGSLTEQRLEKLLSGAVYRKSADEAKKKQIRATVDGARAAARAEMIKRARTAAKP